MIFKGRGLIRADFLNCQLVCREVGERRGTVEAGKSAEGLLFILHLEESQQELRPESSKILRSPPTCGRSELLRNHYYAHGQMREAQLGSHTITSHGIRVARFHMHDWIILLLLIVVDVALNIINPFYRFVGQEMMSDLKYPLKSNTVPFWAVPIVAIVAPMAIFLVYYIYRKDVYDFHHAILGLLFSVLVTAVITDAIKDAVGRPRPDFFWRCFPDGNEVYNPITKGVICHGSKSVVKEGHKSFPSGHTSWSFAGLCFLSLYLSGKIKVFDRNGHVAKLCVVFLPLLVAALVGISRVDDYWHHWQDVFAGAILGSIVAIFCYLQFFPAPYDTQGWGPYAYFQMLAESHNSVEVDAIRVQRTDSELSYQHPTEHQGSSRMLGMSIREAV